MRPELSEEAKYLLLGKEKCSICKNWVDSYDIKRIKVEDKYLSRCYECDARDWQAVMDNM